VLPRHRVRGGGRGFQGGRQQHALRAARPAGPARGPALYALPEHRGVVRLVHGARGGHA
ncbi:unnamed protein product, partial [Prorocentrum cordatum]